ncbi:MAG: hypothetical protein JO043_06725 [Candidatus Eremiobacteraeota bacterium]|nr:hypothetical protein [Candidatus Eremiobacteraeota bacterium]
MADPRTIDVAVLDMNHGLPNVGHQAIIALLRDLAVELEPQLDAAELRIRAISYAVRHRLMVPHHDGRHRLYLGTGGPGHLDPRRNTQNRGEAEILEDPAWEPRLWRLFDDIFADERAALYGVCHTFGLLCRWSQVAEPVLRSAEKGGKMSGVGNDALTDDALVHPWFARLSEDVASRDRVPVLESRYYDLVPNGNVPSGATVIAHEAHDDACSRVRALTMMEFARDGDRPRIFAVNSHPEIGDADRVAALLGTMLAAGAITPEVYAARCAILPVLRSDRNTERLRVARTVFADLARLQLERLVTAA